MKNKYTWIEFAGAVVITVALLIPGVGLAVPVSFLPDVSGLVPYATFGNSYNDNLVTVNGNVGISANGTFIQSAPSVVNGNVYLAGGVSQANIHGTVSGTIFNNQNLSSAQSQVFSASTALQGLSANYTVGALNSSMNFNAVGSGAVTVIDIASIGGSGNINLVGGASDYFVLNVAGNASFTGSAGILGSGGLDASHILVNLYDNTGVLGIVAHVGDVLNGTILVPYDSATFHSENGAIWSGDGEITLMSGATIQNVPFAPPSVPDNGSTLVLLGLALAGLGCMGRKFQVRPALDSARE